MFDWLKGGFRKILDFGNNARNGIKKAYNFIKKIPVIGSAVDGLLDAQIPYINMSANQIGKGLDTALNVGNDIGRIINPLPPTPDAVAKRQPLPAPPIRRY